MTHDVTPTMTPEQWLLGVSPHRPLHRRLRDTPRTRFRPSQRLDLWPDPDGVMRGPDGQPWIPGIEPTWRTGLFGRARRRDWIHHAMSAQSQVRALTRRAEYFRGTGPAGEQEAEQELAAAWDAGYTAAQRYAAEREEDRRVFGRHGISGTHVPDTPQNPHRPGHDWDW